MAEPVETISYVARRLIQYELKFAKAELTRRRGASRLFTQIARSVGSLGPELIRDHLPHDACRELALYASRLADAVSEELGDQESERLAEALAKACDKESLFLEFRTSDRKRVLADELDKAANHIQAQANGIYMAAAEGDFHAGSPGIGPDGIDSDGTGSAGPSPADSAQV
jgi:hypothetical protein